MAGIIEYTSSGIEAQFKQERYLKEASEYRLMSSIRLEQNNKLQKILIAALELTSSKTCRYCQPVIRG